MTLPLIVITKDGHDINISSTQQFRCILVDRTNTGQIESEHLVMVADYPARVYDSGVQCPNEGTDRWIAQVLADIEKGERP